MAPSRNSWSFSIHLYWDFSKRWSHFQKVGVNYSKFGVNETSALADQLLSQLLIEHFDTLPTQCRHIEHMHEGVWFPKKYN